MARVTSDYNLAVMNLAVMNPALARQWHPTLNGDLTPRPAAPFSGKRPWWLYPKGHQWQAIVNNRRRGNGCPYCAGQLVTKDNNLRVINSGLAKQWHPTKNGSLRPKEVRPNSSKMVWWLCSKGHEWTPRLSDRADGRGCPIVRAEKPARITASRPFPHISQVSGIQPRTAISLQGI